MPSPEPLPGMLIEGRLAEASGLGVEDILRALAREVGVLRLIGTSLWTVFRAVVLGVVQSRWWGGDESGGFAAGQPLLRGGAYVLQEDGV